MQTWSILSFLVVLLAIPVVIVVTSIIVSRWRRSGRNVEDGATCGQCSYSVRGVSGLWCPECGADLREVGIDRPAKQTQSSKGGMLLVVIIVAMMMLVGMGMVTYFFKSSPPPKATPAPTTMPNAPVKTTTPNSPRTNP